jgi:hypothetical protein
MRSIKKVGLLIALLAGPALIFLYLVTFTTNHYDVPYYFPEVDEQTGMVQLDGNDTVYYQVPHQIGSLALFDANCKATLISIVPEDCQDDCLRQIMNFGVVQETIDEFEQNCFTVYQAPTESHKEIPSLVKRVTTIDSAEYVALSNALRLNSEEAKGANAVLLDYKGRIRGFFKLHNKVELDRLFAEMKILNHNLTTEK